MTPEEKQKFDALEKDFNNHLHRGYDGSLVLSQADIIDKDTFTAYEAISANNPVRIAFGTVTYLNQTSTAFVDANINGTGGTSEQQATTFTVSAPGVSVTTVIMYIRKVNSPVDNVVCTIVADSGGDPTGATQGVTASVSAASISTSVGPVSFTFATPVVLTAGTYWVKASRSGSFDSTNRCQLANDGSSATASNKQLNSGAWVNTSVLSFVVERIDGTAGQLVRSYGTTFDVAPFIGFAIASIAAGSSGLVKLLGIMDGFSSLSPGKRYYLTNAGGVGTTAGTFVKQVGVATSTTEILIQPNEIA
jgi:hypothetical protein